MGFILKSAIWTALIYLCVCGVMYAKQRKLQYHPDKERVSPATYNLDTVTDVELVTADGETVHGWYARPKDPEKPVIVYFHGNAEAVQTRWERARLFTDEEYGLFMLSYRGFAGSTGHPTEKGLIQDAQAVIAFLNKQGFAGHDLVYWGESLGSGVATQLAVKHPPAAIILEAPFTSAADVARTMYWFLPINLLMKDQFRSIDHIGSVSAPVFVIHGDEDAVVPYDMGQQLYTAVNTRKEFYAIPGGGHVDPLTLPLWHAVKKFIAVRRD